MLASKFKTKDLGVARWVLGMRLVQTASFYSLDQIQYARDVLARFRTYMKIGSRSIGVPSTPLPAKMDLRRATEDGNAVDLPYRELLGSIGHLAIGTRIDIAFPVSLLSRFVSRPAQKDWAAAIHVLRYLRGHHELGLRYTRRSTMVKFDPLALNKEETSEPDAAVDSDFANDPDTAKSVGGLIVNLFGTAVSWRSKLQSLVATSTCHAEYVAAFECAREVTWLRMLLTEIGFVLSGPSIMLEDNAAAKWTAETVGISDANKHIRVKYHWVRECVRDGFLRLKTVASKENPADALTKIPVAQSLKVMMKSAGMSSSALDGQPDQGG
jgi:hypothetical protein